MILKKIFWANFAILDFRSSAKFSSALIFRTLKWCTGSWTQHRPPKTRLFLFLRVTEFPSASILSSSVFALRELVQRRVWQKTVFLSIEHTCCTWMWNIESVLRCPESLGYFPLLAWRTPVPLLKLGYFHGRETKSSSEKASPDFLRLVCQAFLAIRVWKKRCLSSQPWRLVLEKGTQYRNPPFFHLAWHCADVCCSNPWCIAN